MINEAMARKFWADQNPLGKQVNIGGKDVTIVGIVKDAKFNNLLDDSPPYLFAPLAQQMSDSGLSTLTLMVRTDADPESLFANIERKARGIDESVPVFNVKVLGDNVGRLLIAERFASTLLSLFSLVTLALASIGIYGVIAYSVSQRTKEIGIRLALGAERRTILGLILGQGSLPIVIGIGFGIASAVALTRVIESLLFQVTATDPLTFFAAAAFLFFVALLACYLPARRATKVDPMVALRYE
jgi:putative ABC transport system permease protein